MAVYVVIPGNSCCSPFLPIPPSQWRRLNFPHQDFPPTKNARCFRMTVNSNLNPRIKSSKPVPRPSESVDLNSAVLNSVPEAAPPLTAPEPNESSNLSNEKTWNSETQGEDNDRLALSKMASPSSGSFSGEVPLLRILGRKLLRTLASLKLAIAELFIIAGISALGTIIVQGESPEYYYQYYPEDNPLFGFLSWRWVLGLSLDHVYSSPYYVGLLLLLAASLMACTSTRQLPNVKVARRWSFLKSGSSFSKLQVKETLPNARLGDLSTLLMMNNYEVFVKGPMLYAFKGLAGRYAPIGVHISLLLIMGGGALSALGSYHGNVMLPQGLNFLVGDFLHPTGFLSTPTSVMNTQVHLNKFFIDYLPTGEVRQFHSDLSLLNLKDQEILRKTTSVNDPLKYGGVTMYQTDWSISAVQIRVDGSDPFNLPMAALETGNKKLFGTFLPLGKEGLTNANGISLLARDLQSVVIYDQEGKFVGVRRPGSDRPVLVNGLNIVLDDIIGSSGMELKMDPGVPYVYAGFGGLMLTTCISYLSHSQVWALQEGMNLIVGGKANRGKVELRNELNKMFDMVPEIVTRTKLGTVITSDSTCELVDTSQNQDIKDALAQVVRDKMSLEPVVEESPVGSPK